MSQSEKAAYFRALKAAGVQFERHYREYSTAELKKGYDELLAAGQIQPVVIPEPEPAPVAGTSPLEAALREQQRINAELMAQLQQQAAIDAGLKAPPMAEPAAPTSAPTLPRIDPTAPEMAGSRLNVQLEDEPIGVDEEGLIWYQKEVRKPAFAKPRGRRVLRYNDTGVKTETAKDGKYVETFEVAGDGPPVATEVKVTLPSYQVGIYKDPRLPFKVHVYNDRRGFDFFEVNDYYGGVEMVPSRVKRIYVENVLCYDIRLTVQAIQDEYRQLQLAGKVD